MACACQCRACASFFCRQFHSQQGTEGRRGLEPLSGLLEERSNANEWPVYRYAIRERNVVQGSARSHHDACWYARIVCCPQVLCRSLQNENKLALASGMWGKLGRRRLETPSSLIVVDDCRGKVRQRARDILYCHFFDFIITQPMNVPAAAVTTQNAYDGSAMAQYRSGKYCCSGWSASING